MQQTQAEDVVVQSVPSPFLRRLCPQRFLLIIYMPEGTQGRDEGVVVRKNFYEGNCCAVPTGKTCVQEMQSGVFMGG